MRCATASKSLKTAGRIFTEGVGRRCPLLMPLRPTPASSNSPSTSVGAGSRRPLRPLYLLSALLILGLTAYVRLAYRADNPGWYTDEGTHLAIAQQLLQGRVEDLALNPSTLLAGRRPPLHLFS